MSRSHRWRDLRVRFASAVVLAPLALACIWFGGWPFQALVAGIVAGMATEWIGMGRHASAYGQPPSPALWLFGIAYILVPALALVWLRADVQAGQANVIILLLIVWASDIGAYVVGRAIGGPRLAPAISPGKTISGAVGGLATALLTGLAASYALDAAAPLRAMALAGLTGCVAQAGDLFESYLKRRFGVKDSGKIIPGHGGLLDRLDALMAAAPFAALLALALGRGVVIWQ